MSSPAPVWLDDIVREFGRSTGLSDFALNDSGAAAVTFETGAQLRFEYAFESLVVALSVPFPGGDPAAARRLLAAAHPGARPGFKLRAGLLEKSGRAILAARFPEREATLPAVNAAFSALWRIADDLSGGPA
ncbi:MAG: CesT family type III secretion system chaperone [Kiritimatiellae bacterium]|nr:CesT family type III secretion system chaperone [Kiritimatiellia bacterium]